MLATSGFALALLLLAACDAPGNVTDYELSASRMRGIRFEREKPNL